jgi:hypothetical protein
VQIHDPCIACLLDVESAIEHDIIRPMVLGSCILQESRDKKGIILSSIIKSRCKRSEILCWSIHPVLHKVIARTVILDHVFLGGHHHHHHLKGMTDEQDLSVIVRNLLSMVSNMQASSCGNVNVFFRKSIINSSSVGENEEGIGMFLEGNEEILEDDILFELCSNPNVKLLKTPRTTGKQGSSRANSIQVAALQLHTPTTRQTDVRMIS